MSAARQLWANAGLSAAQLALIAQTHFTVADLGNGIVAASSGNQVSIDRLAANYGWFVDSTPLDNAEFAGTATLMTAQAGSAAATQLDLLTAVMNQMGQIAGVSATTAPDVMNLNLTPGKRALPPAAAGTSALSNQLSSLQTTYGFHSVGSYYQNYGGLNEKWFEDRNNHWFVITPDGTILSWTTGPLAGSPTVAVTDPSVYANPNLLFQAPVTLSGSEQAQLAACSRPTVST